MPEEHNSDFYKLDSLTQDMANGLICPFNHHYCRGRWCMAWRVHKEEVPMRGYCKLIDK